MSYCECTGPGFCSKHQFTKTKRDFELCKGIKCSPDICKKYRAAWEAGTTVSQTRERMSSSSIASRPPGTAPPAPLVRQVTAEDVPCEYRLEVIRSDSCTVCGGLKGLPTDVYGCSLPSNIKKECTLGHFIHGMPSCQRCEHGIDAFSDAMTNKKQEAKRANRKIRASESSSRHQNATYLEGAGTELINIFKNAGVPSCKACKDLASEMDRMGIDKCEETIDEIVSKMIPRARDWIATNKKWVHRLLPNAIEDAGIQIRLKSYVNEAIKTARSKKKSFDFEKAKRYMGPKSLDIPQPEPYVFPGKPHKTLLFHLYPVPGAVEYHFDKLSSVIDGFDRKIMGIARDTSTIDPEEIKERFGDGWEYVTVRNNKDLREVVTYRKMLNMLDFSDPNHVTFCAHGKGTQDHTVKSEPVTWWTDAMYETVLGNQDGVIKEFEKGFKITGSFRRLGKSLNTKYRWHYSGTFYAFKNDKFRDEKIPKFSSKWWGTESWPGDHFGINESSVIFNEGTHSGDLYKPDLQPRKELEDWINDNKTKGNVS